MTKARPTAVILNLNCYLHQDQDQDRVPITQAIILRVLTLQVMNIELKRPRQQAPPNNIRRRHLGVWPQERSRTIFGRKF